MCSCLLVYMWKRDRECVKGVCFGYCCDLVWQSVGLHTQKTHDHHHRYINKTKKCVLFVSKSLYLK